MGGFETTHVCESILPPDFSGPPGSGLPLHADLGGEHGAMLGPREGYEQETVQGKQKNNWGHKKTGAPTRIEGGFPVPFFFKHMIEVYRVF